MNRFLAVISQNLQSIREHATPKSKSDVRRFFEEKILLASFLLVAAQSSNPAPKTLFSRSWATRKAVSRKTESN
jgi:hypothetical protein